MVVCAETCREIKCIVEREYTNYRFYFTDNPDIGYQSESDYL
jgi:hypothetical protein